jgi:hypothetical protein
MAALELLRQSGWSFRVGFSHDHKGYYAMAWKQRGKPEKVRCPGGGDVTLFTYCVSAMGESIEDAAVNCAQQATYHGTGAWWEGLPITHVTH